MQGIIAHKTTLGEYQTIPCKTGPAFIHYLCLHLRHEIQHLGAYYFNDVALPGLQVWGMAAQKEQDVFFWFFWKFGWFAAVFFAFLLGLFCLFLKAPQVVVFAFRCRRLLVGFCLLIVAQQLVIIYMFLN